MLIRSLAAAALCALLPVLPAMAQTTAVDPGFRVAVVAERARPPAPKLPRARFLLRAPTREVHLSPDGRQVAYLRVSGDEQSLWVLDTASGATRRLLAHSRAQGLAWSQDGRWLMLQEPDRLFAVAAAGQGGSGLMTRLGGPHRLEWMGVDPSRPAAALVRERDGDRWRLLRVDVRGRRTLLHEDDRKIVDFAFDAHGRLAYLQRVEDATLAILRRDGSGAWKPFLRCRKLHVCALLPRTAGDGTLRMLTDLGGDQRRLVRVDADGSLHTLHQDPHGASDPDMIVLDPDGGTPLALGYNAVDDAVYGLTEGARKAVAELAARLPGRRLKLEYGGGSRPLWLVGERAGSLQGTRWHLFDPRNGILRDILQLPPQTRDGRAAHWLPESAMAHKLPFAWTASDGMRLHGFVWIPPGIDAAGAPLAALIHGGPWSHVDAGDFGTGIAQFLVNRGYVVFEPNFRASSGLGRHYMLSAHGDLGNGRVQRDIVEGVRALLMRGVGDGDRVGIVGASFGGYSALLGVTFQPQLFKVGVALVPPTDLAWDLRWVLRSREALALARSIPMRDWMRQLSLDPEDASAMAPLHAQSPLANAARMRRPLLLFAGGQDHRVAIRGVLAYAAKLRTLGRDVNLLVDDAAGHTKGAPETEEASFYLTARMLHAHLGGEAAEPPPPRLRAYLQHSLRIAGPDLRDLQQ